jgi:spermidine synthase
MTETTTTSLTTTPLPVGSAHVDRSRPALDLFLVSGLILFLELAFIRWFPAHVLFLTFFTNTVLLACFVGMSIGCLTARSPRRHLLGTPLLLAVAVGIGALLNPLRSRLEHYVNVGNQANPDVVFFGTEASAYRDPTFLVPVELIIGLMFLLIAAAMVGPGQEMGRAFNRVPNRIRAYAANLAGSLAGIVLFAACSWLHLSPVVWFAASALGVYYFLSRRDPDAIPGTPRPRLGTAALLLAMAVVVTVPTAGLVARDSGRQETFWSPYYRVDHLKESGTIVTNLIGHQVMLPRDKPGEVAYHLPHLFNHEVGRPPFRRILVIGAGSGNDVSRALLWADPDVAIDAVDIEPVIQRIGGEYHPDRPYDDPRVTLHLDDGRNFLRRAPDGEYDLVVYALVDSLVLHSGYGNIRLESYLFTEQAFADVRRVLRPDGTFAVYNYFRQGWIVARLREALRTAFGADPVALTDPPSAEVRHDGHAAGDGLFTMFLAGPEETVRPVREKFAGSGNKFWVPKNKPITHDTPFRFSPEPPPADDGSGVQTEWVALMAAEVEDSQGALRPATDEWPFLYTRQPTVPGYVLRGMVLLVLLSLALWTAYRPRRGELDPSAGVVAAGPAEAGLLIRAFALGAGFMLIETKAVVQMALLFGSTWAVNTVVFAAILMMALAGNLYAALVKPTRLGPYYVGLFAALGANLLIPLDAFLGLDRPVQIALSCALVFAPVAFAGVVFPVSFARAPRPDRFFGANVAGALVGGLAENMSMLVGFRYLLLVAVLAYAASGLFGRTAVPTREATQGV